MDRIVVRAYLAASAFERQMREIKAATDCVTRPLVRGLREMEIQARPGWIDADPPTFVFPGWGPRWRPFDWSVDA